MNLWESFPFEAFFASGALFFERKNLHETITLGWGQASWAERPPQDRLCFYLPDFFLNAQAPWVIFQYSKECDLVEWQSSLAEWIKRTQPEPSLEGLSPWIQPGFEHFSAIFASLQQQLASQRLRKAVLVAFQVMHAPWNQMHLARALENLLISTQGFPFFLYGYWNQQQGWLGATPEFLFLKSHKQPQSVATSDCGSGGEGRIELMALAGTMATARNAGLPAATSESPSRKHPLLLLAKEQLEHAVVVEGIQAAVGQAIQAGLIADGQVVQGERQVLHLPTMSHLFTPLFFEPLLDAGDRSSSPTAKSEVVAHQDSSQQFEAWVKALHPTPALGAYPKEAGLHWLQVQDAQAPADQKRDRFGAPFGVIWPTVQLSNMTQAPPTASPSQGHWACLVSIRQLAWEQGRIRIGSGCGVIATSDLQAEWAELALKRRAVEQLMKLSGSLLESASDLAVVGEA